MALESGTRRVRMVGAEHWTDAPERDLATIAAGGDTYAVHERLCIDSPRVRLALADGEDAAAALRQLPGELVRDVRVFRLVETGPGAEITEGLPEWRLTLPSLDDDAEHDPLPALIARLAGVSAVSAVSAPETVDVVEADAVEGLEAPTAAAVELSGLVLDEPAAEAAPEPVVADVDPFVLPVEAVQPVVMDVDPFAVPAESVFPVEAPEVVEAPVDVEPLAVALPAIEVVPDEPVVVEAAAVAEPVVVVAEAVAEPEPESEPEPDPRDLAFAAVASVLAAGRPTCAATDRDGACSAACDVVWQTPAGAAWSCAWHWPSTMAGHAGAEIGAVHVAGAWATWRDGDSVALARQAADLFADSARGHDKPVARPLVALDRLDEMLRTLPDDLRGAVVLWAIAVTNPDWDVPAVAEHGRVSLQAAVADGRAVAFPDELYFQDDVAAAPISPTSGESQEPVPDTSGDDLFAQGTALAAAGDRRGAAAAWTEAAESHDHALSMRALGDLATDRDEVKTAEEWYGRAAMVGDTPSMTRIAALLTQRGQSERAAEWLRRAARFGDEDALRQLQGAAVASA